MSVPLVLLAAGLSTRYGRLKQLDGLGPGGESIMDYNIFDAARAGFDRIILIVRPEIEAEVRAHVSALVGSAIPVHYVNQTLDHLPEGYRAPPDRVRPWGTGHAAICASSLVDGPFALCNSDDLYGSGSFKMLHQHLDADLVPTPAALVGYTLGDTLSGSGGVSRGLCVLSRDGLLSQVTEVRDIRNQDGFISGRYTDGAAVQLSEEAIVSMNLWGFTPRVVEQLDRQFRRFLDMWGADTAAEFYLSTALNGQIQIGSTSALVLHAPDQWFGITHAEDREQARSLLRERISEGVYPERLANGFAELTESGR